MYKVSEKAQNIHTYFNSQKEQNVEHIASPVTIDALLCVAERIQPQRILELGGGGGTLTFTLLKHTQAHVDVYEDKPFCQENIKHNCTPFDGRYTILKTYDTLPPSSYYEMVIIDGPAPKQVYDWREREEIVERLLTSLNSIRTVYIEGYRYPQRIVALKALKRSYIITRLVRHWGYAQKGLTQKGGLEIRCVESNNAFMRHMAFLLWFTLEFSYQKIALLIRKLYWKCVGRFINAAKQRLSALIHSIQR